MNNHRPSHAHALSPEPNGRDTKVCVYDFVTERWVPCCAGCGAIVNATCSEDCCYRRKREREAKYHG